MLGLHQIPWFFYSILNEKSIIEMISWLSLTVIVVKLWHCQVPLPWKVLHHCRDQSQYDWLAATHFFPFSQLPWRECSTNSRLLLHKNTVACHSCCSMGWTHIELTCEKVKPVPAVSPAGIQLPLCCDVKPNLPYSSTDFLLNVHSDHTMKNLIYPCS